jgi:hypothetical protein
MILIGCDPGVTGALALFLGDDLMAVVDMPSDLTITKSKGSEIRDLIGGPVEHKQRRINPVRLTDLLRPWIIDNTVIVVREKVQPRGGQGAVSSGTLMETAGLVDGVCVALGATVLLAEPARWKRVMGLNNDKKVSCKCAIKEFPRLKHEFRRTSIDHNKAEAALLGLYGIRHLIR